MLSNFSKTYLNVFLDMPKRDIKNLILGNVSLVAALECLELCCISLSILVIKHLPKKSVTIFGYGKQRDDGSHMKSREK